MAVLVIAGGTDLDELVVDRLLGQGDEVRLLEPTPARRERWQARGAFVAVGEADDPDLVERAAQNARTIVVLTGQVTPEVVRNVLEVGPDAGVDRLLLCASSISDEVREAVRSERMDHVLMETGRPGLLRRRTASPQLVAEAVDAADDLAGEPRLELDLNDPVQRRLLGL